MPAIPAQRELTWRPLPEDVAAAGYLTRQLTHAPGGAFGRCFRAVNTAAISPSAQRAQARREQVRGWNQQLAELLADLGNPAIENPLTA